jgi:ubiquinone/menaquinone biosynthesis C-methylase UbiE
MSLVQHLLGRAIFPPRYAWFLEGSWRRILLSPERLRQRLQLSPQLKVLEIGAGGGYYAHPLSSFVRCFVALDIQRDMLTRLQKKPAVTQLSLVQGDATRLPVASSSIDVVIAVTVLGEVPSAEATVAEVRRVLRPAGVFAVSEHWPDTDFVPFPVLDSLCRANGFRLDRRYGARFNYTAVFAANAA